MRKQTTIIDAPIWVVVLGLWVLGYTLYKVFWWWAM